RRGRARRAARARVPPHRRVPVPGRVRACRAACTVCAVLPTAQARRVPGVERSVPVAHRLTAAAPSMHTRAMSPACRFGDFVLDRATRELSRGGERIALPAKAFDCVVYLLEHRGRAVGRDELIAAVWGRADVSDSVLSQTVLHARRALDDTG